MKHNSYLSPTKLKIAGCSGLHVMFWVSCLYPHAECTIWWNLTKEIWLLIRICKWISKCRRNLECSIQTNIGQKRLVGKLRLVGLVLGNFWREHLPEWFHLKRYKSNPIKFLSINIEWKWKIKMRLIYISQNNEWRSRYIREREWLQCSTRSPYAGKSYELQFEWFLFRNCRFTFFCLELLGGGNSLRKYTMYFTKSIPYVANYIFS